MAECERCGLDTDLESSFTYGESDVEITLYLCGLCGDKIKEFIGRGIQTHEKTIENQKKLFEQVYKNILSKGVGDLPINMDRVQAVYKEVNKDIRLEKYKHL